jgi:alginate O-acetyltransferase complex protein AlgI
MAFSSILFLVYFFPFFLLLLELTPGRWIKQYLLAASIIFYGWGAPVFLFCLLFLTIINFYLVRWLDRQDQLRRRKHALIIAVILNLATLIYFKYAGFFVSNFQAILDMFGVDHADLQYEVALPIGISFFTFESLTYIIDVYRKEQAPLKSFWDFQLYIIYFPKLIAGPIIRYKDIAHQIEPVLEPAVYAQKIHGLMIFTIGLCKKVLIANTISPVAAGLLNAPYAQSGVTAWIGIIAYTFQIYYDFSGYSDMAIGISKIIGLDLKHNFNNPYAAYSVTEFWKRWHISMTSWFRNYVYIPLGGNRGRKFQTYRNLLIVFLLSGFWHGAKWSYVLWGGYHGFWLIMERVVLKKMIERLKWLYLPVTFFILAIGWLFFKVENISNAMILLRKMFGLEHYQVSATLMHFQIGNDVIIAMILAAVFSFSAISPKVISAQQKIYYNVPGKGMILPVAILCIVLYFLCLAFLTAGKFNPFIYFRF